MSLTIKNLSVSVGGKHNSDLSAVIDGKVILNNINLNIKKGELHVLMGPNGSGKSTLAQVLLGNTAYDFPDSGVSMVMDNRDITRLSSNERAKYGIFLGFQNPVGIPGVNVVNLLRAAKQAIDGFYRKEKPLHNPVLSVWEINKLILKTALDLQIPREFLRRSLDEDFSGGEKKKLELLQALILQPKYAVFDEIDTGLDVDALKIIAKGLDTLKKKGCGILLITHYQRILRYLETDMVYIMTKGTIREKGDISLVRLVEKEGYKKWVE